MSTMPSLPLFDQCCGCIELRSGCLIIGYVNLIGGALIFLFAGVFGIVGGAVLVSMKPTEVKDVETAHAAGAALIGISILLLIVIGFSIAISIVLLVGLHQNKRGHVKLYLIAETICLAVMVVVTLAGIGHSTALSISSNLISAMISVYFLLVIRSYYYKMDDSNQKPAVYTSA